MKIPEGILEECCSPLMLICISLNFQEASDLTFQCQLLISFSSLRFLKYLDLGSSIEMRKFKFKRGEELVISCY